MKYTILDANNVDIILDADPSNKHFDTFAAAHAEMQVLIKDCDDLALPLRVAVVPDSKVATGLIYTDAQNRIV